jgi:hypothetical protein
LAENRKVIALAFSLFAGLYPDPGAGSFIGETPLLLGYKSLQK